MNNNHIENLFHKSLSGTGTKIEKEELNHWIGANPGLRQWMEQEMGGSPQLMNTARQEKLLQHIHGKITKQKKSKASMMFSRLRNVAAVLLIAITAGSLFYSIRQSNRIESQETVIEARRGQKSNITLPDGTVITLNSDTKLSYSNDFNVKSRHVTLIGEAYFDVAQNPNMPFYVNVGGITVKAVGTAFNIRAYDNESIISAILVEGGIHIKTPSEEIRMTPNERLEYNVVTGSGTKIVLPDDALLSVGWLNDRLSFKNTTLAEIAAELSRCYNVDIVFNNEAAKQQRFTGKISNNSLETVLRILSLTSPIQYKIEENEIVIF